MSDLKCMYCAEMGITNTDVFIEIVDVELGAGWICKECFIESEKEKEEHLKDLEQELKAKEQECEKLKSDNLQEVGQLKFAIGTLTAENLHLKELLDMRIEALCDSCKAGSMLPIKCRIYEKTLTEIKEIAEPYYTLGSKDSPVAQILQKISECEVGNV